MRQTLLFAATFILVTQLTAQETVEAQNWLTTAIEEYFAQFPPKPFNSIATERYSEYKHDAICQIYDCVDSLTTEEFNRKWGGIYDITDAAIDEGFLIDQQDWGEIEVTKCELINESKSGICIFDTTIRDIELELTHSKEITVIRTAKGFKIDGVKTLK